MFTCFEEIQAYIEECEQKRLDLESVEVRSKASYPPHEQPRHKVITEAK